MMNTDCYSLYSYSKAEYSLRQVAAGDGDSKTTPHTPGSGLTGFALPVHRTSIAPVLITTNAIENTNILSSLPAAPGSTMSSANPNFLTPGCPGGRISFSYFLTTLVKLLIPSNPDIERMLEFTRDVSSTGSEMRDESQEDQPSNLNLSFHSLPYSVTGSPCLSHVNSNLPISRKLGNSNVDVDWLVVRGKWGPG